MRLSDVVKRKTPKEGSRSVTVRVPRAYIAFVKKHGISWSLLVCKALDEIIKKEEGGVTR